MTTRTRELGVRLALGANPRQLLRSVLGGALKLAALALAIGLPLVFATGIALRSFLYGVKPHNVEVLVAACLVIGISTVAAAYIPARRASRVEPLVALRYQ